MLLFTGGSGISVPIENEKLKDEIKAQVDEGILLLGEMIVPKVFKRITIDPITQELKHSEHVVSGRKIFLNDIRKSIPYHSG